MPTSFQDKSYVLPSYFTFRDTSRKCYVYKYKTSGERSQLAGLGDLKLVPVININNNAGNIRVFYEEEAIGIYKGLDMKIKCIKKKKELAKEWYENTCSWLVTHKQLPIELTRIIGTYLRPPPFIFFKKGDLYISLSVCMNSMTIDFIARPVEEAL